MKLTLHHDNQRCIKSKFKGILYTGTTGYKDEAVNFNNPHFQDKVHDEVQDGKPANKQTQKQTKPLKMLNLPLTSEMSLAES